MTSGEGLKLVFSESPVATLVIDREGHVVDVNRAAVKAMARGRERLVGTPILSWIVPEDRDRARDLFVKAMGGRSSDWTVRVKRGDGVTRLLSLRTLPIGQEGQAKGILAFARDLTTPQEGRPDADQLQALLENLPGQFVIALDRRGRIRYTSGLFRTLLVHDEDPVGEPFGTLTTRDSRNVELSDYMLEELRTGRDWGGLVWYRAADGTRVPAHTFATPYRDPKSGRILGGLIAARDARVELKQRELASRSKRLSSIGSLVGDVAGSLSEQLSAAEEELTNGRSANAAEDGRTSPASGLALARLACFLGELEAYASETERELDSVSVDDVLEAALSRHSARLEAMGVEVIRTSEVTARSVFADRDQLIRVLDAIIDNASASLDGVSLPRLRVEVEDGVEAVTIRVSDSAAALPDDSADDVFEPFFTTRSGHAGLGLSTARAIVTSLGGTISAAIGDGWTTFTLELSHLGRDASIPFTIAPARSARARTVLVVDDEEAVRKSIRKFLEKVGYEVREAWSGRSALAQVTAGDPPELVLTDLKMADGSGYWFLSEVSRDFPDLIRRTVVLTGDTQSEDAERLLRETGCPIIRKPVELSHLLEVLDQVAVAG